MSRETSENSRSMLWTGKPWILPDALGRGILIIAIAVVVSWLELFFDLAFKSFLNIPLILWTGLAFCLIWIVSLTHLLLLRASNTYILRNDSLEIRTGILTSKSFTVASSGFADMEVIRSLSGRILNLGSIVIRTQDESGADKRLQKVRNPLKVADQIREVMAKPMMRIEGQETFRQQK
jgi:uncharacterized membrane protein YdbT with pleckstrin-like domain